MFCASDSLPDFTNITVGHYRLTRMLGTGTFGVVYKALDTTLSPSDDADVYRAMKIVRKAGRSPHELATIRREIALHSSVSHHPAVVTLHDAWDDEEYFYLVLDYCPAGDLFEQVADGMYQDEDELLRGVFLSLIDAVEACHEAGFAHRDLKPENVLLDLSCSKAFLADFGLATNTRLCKDFGTGTPTYMAPECYGRTPYCPFAGDIWALGVIFVNLIGGITPWMDATPADGAFAHFLADPFYFRHRIPISGAAHALLARMLALDPAERIALRELRAEVEDIDSFFNGDAQHARRGPLRLVQSLSLSRLRDSDSDSDEEEESRASAASEYSAVDGDRDGYFRSLPLPGLSPSGSSDAGSGSDGSVMRPVCMPGKPRLSMKATMEEADWREFAQEIFAEHREL